MYYVKHAYQDKRYASIYDNEDRGPMEGRRIGIPKGNLKIDSPTGRKALPLTSLCTGRLSRLILKSGYHWIGADISLEMMVESRKKLMNGFEGYSWWNIRLDAERMPFKDDSLDCIFSIRFIYHIPER